MFCGVTALSSQGCAAPVDEPAQADEELRALSLKIVGSGGLHVRDTPRLAPGAEEQLGGCERFDAGDRTRIACGRDRELLEVIVDKAAARAVVVHRPEGRFRDKRTFFTCTTSGNGPGDLPATLACEAKKPASSSGHGGLASPFPSTVPGLHIPNSHEVGAGGLLVRGMAPRSAEHYDQLFAAGVGAVLVFKNPTRDGSDVSDELDELAARGLGPEQIAHIPFRWKDLPGFEEPCQQTVHALQFLAANATAGRKTFFHCTVGEDRTGLLAAVHRLLEEPGLAAEAAWDHEMCERGYGSGNPLKPAFVVGALEGGLTPLYRKLAYLVAKGRLRAGALDPAVCAVDPATEPEFEAEAVPHARLRCGTSTRYEP